MAHKFAIVTGASTGIGFELASIAAEKGYDLLVVADEPLIDAAAQDLKRHGVQVTSVQADLATLQGVDQLLAATNGRQIDVLCANAGRGLGLTVGVGVELLLAAGRDHALHVVGLDREVHDRPVRREARDERD